MKKLRKMLATLVLVSFAIVAISQGDSATQSNFYYIKKLWQDHFDSIAAKTGGNLQGTGHINFKRWENFWEERVWPSGDYSKFGNAMQSYWNNQNAMMLSSSTSTSTQNCSPSVSNWQPLGPSDHPPGGNTSSGVGRVIALAFDPKNSNIMYAGAMSGGLWKSVDGGNNWEKLNTDNLPVIGVASIAIDPKNSNIIYIGTGSHANPGISYHSSIGVYKSTDGGQTWVPCLYSIHDHHFEIGRGYNVHINRIIINPRNPNLIYVATHWWNSWTSKKEDLGAVFRSEDGGQTWAKALKGFFWDLEFKPDNPDYIFACGKEVFKSVDGGYFWTQLFPPGMDLLDYRANGDPYYYVNESSMARICVTPADPNRLYVVAMKGATNGGIVDGIWLYNLVNGTFIKKNANNASGIIPTQYKFSAAASTTNPDLLYVGGVRLSYSTDGGNNFVSDMSNIHADIPALEFLPEDGKILYAGTDGGVFKNSNAGNLSVWERKSKGLQITQFYRLGLSKTFPTMLAAGAHDVTQMLYDGQGNWKQIYGQGDGMECAIDPDNPSIIYVESQSGNMVRSINGGNSFTSIVPNSAINERANWVTPYLIHHTQPNILYAAYQNVHKSEQRGNQGSWEPLSNFIADFGISGNNTIKSLAVAPSDPDNTIYVGFQEGVWSAGTNWTSTTGTLSKQLFKTNNGGTTWFDVSPQIPGLLAQITYITIHPTNKNKVWVTYSGFYDNNNQSKKVFVTNDGGATWTDYSQGIPFFPANTIVIDPTSSKEALYIGTDVGVYYRDNTMNSWIPFDNNLPNVIVSELEISPFSRQIFAATYGRAAWVSNLRDQYDFNIYENKLCLVLKKVYSI